MDQLLFHPKVVHLPIALAVLMPAIVGGALWSWRRGWLDRRAWAGVVLLQATLVGTGFLAMNTGEAEEDRVERVVAETYIEEHEEAAELFVWSSAAVLLMIALPLAFPEGRLWRASALVALAGTLVVLGLGYRAGEAGGRLVYEHGAAQVYTAGAGSSKVRAVEEHPAEDHDDD